MKKDLLILFIGIFLGATLSYFVSSKFQSSILTDNNITPPSENPSIANQNSFAISTEINHQPQTNNTNEEPVNNTQNLIQNDNPDSLRSQLLFQIQNFPDNKIKWLKNILDKFDELQTDKLFELESRDPDIAIGMEDKLRYDFYEQNATNGEGNIDSLECRTRYCKARISLPKVETRLASDRLDNAFPGIVLQNFNLDTQDDPNLISFDVYIDLKIYEMSINLEDAEKP
jgi:hypothetical protein